MALALPWGVGLPAPALADGQRETTAAEKRVIGDRLVIAGRQRMLAERMAARLCLIEIGVAVEQSRQDLYVTWSIFRWYHSGLLNGNIQLQLFPERNVGVINAWREADQVWGALSSLYEPVIDGAPVDVGVADLSIALTDTLTDGTTNVVAALRGAYAKQLGPQGFGNALLLDLYERQRMLGQRITKNVCLIAKGDRDDARLRDLAETTDRFAVSLDAFRTGLADAGVAKPPTEGIAAGLDAALAAWEPAEPIARGTALGGAMDQQVLLAFVETMERVNIAMTAVINELVRVNAQ